MHDFEQSRFQEVIFRKKDEDFTYKSSIQADLRLWIAEGQRWEEILSPSNLHCRKVYGYSHNKK
jgi:hypothetical protein